MSWQLVLRILLRTDWRDKERIVSPLLWAVTVTVIIAMCGQVAPSISRPYFFLAEFLLSIFFGVQILLTRIFEPMRTDRFFDQLRIMPNSAGPIYWGVLAYIFVAGLGIMLATMFVVGVMADVDMNVIIFFLVMAPILALILGGVSAVGVLLSGITMTSGARHVVFPILFFPMCSPLLFAAISVAQGFIQNSTEIIENIRFWYAVLGGFCIVYLVLGWLLFEEIVAAE